MLLQEAAPAAVGVALATEVVVVVAVVVVAGVADGLL